MKPAEGVVAPLSPSAQGKPSAVEVASEAAAAQEIDNEADVQRYQESAAVKGNNSDL